ncbi:hypothetical protein C8J56DRAFT_951068 [Mycena floridula]|nr:hypothetical protein C8J56DRAFT_951068 [Mycena floridula]
MRESQASGQLYPDQAAPESDGDVTHLKVINKKENAGQATKPSQPHDIGLHTMPLDILFEIFDCLEPNDLVDLAKVNVTFWETLVAENAIPVWRKARQRYEMPAPVTGFSEIAWASFLFERPHCQLCGTSHTRSQDFGIMKIVCNGCLQKNIWTEYGNKEFDPSILDLVPFTPAGSKVRLFWKKHIFKVQAKIAELDRAVADGKMDAQKNLEEYKAGRLAFVSDVRKQGTMASIWFRVNTLKTVAAERAKFKATRLFG